MIWFKERRRKKIGRREFSSAWRQTIERNIPLVRYFPPGDREELERHIQVFLAEKRFEGAGGLAMTDEIRVTIAAQACVLLLHRKTDYYPGLYSIIVYPHAYLAHRSDQDSMGIVTEGMQSRLGESWTQGAIVLSWDDVKSGAAGMNDGHNVVFHEFAHQLDAESGEVDGIPILPHRSRYRAWAQVFGEEYAKLQQDIERGQEILLDRYGATNPAEFFAVATEFFFEKPKQLKGKLPRLYDELSRYYKQDPAALNTYERF
ncbi:zinc-dependent peptidase [Candidatus Bipolaricaulota bacterium]|nr:zinc-dependent peptidase [Candidatus Bipolaricaulota bacterium]